MPGEGNWLWDASQEVAFVDAFSESATSWLRNDGIAALLMTAGSTDGLIDMLFPVCAIARVF